MTFIQIYFLRFQIFFFSTFDSKSLTRLLPKLYSTQSYYHYLLLLLLLLLSLLLLLLLIFSPPPSSDSRAFVPPLPHQAMRFFATSESRRDYQSTSDLSKNSVRKKIKKMFFFFIPCHREFS